MQLECTKTEHFSPRFAKKQDSVVGFYHCGSHLWAAPHGERNLALLAVVHRPLVDFIDGKCYPLVNVYITVKNHHFQWVNPLLADVVSYPRHPEVTPSQWHTGLPQSNRKLPQGPNPIDTLVPRHRWFANKILKMCPCHCEPHI